MGCAQKNFMVDKTLKDEDGNDVTTRNLFVIKLMTSLKSRGFVKEQFIWQRFYQKRTSSRKFPTDPLVVVASVAVVDAVLVAATVADAVTDAEVRAEVTIVYATHTEVEVASVVVAADFLVMIVLIPIGEIDDCLE